LRHSTGRLFWLGNILPTNPTGNRPRYPFVIGEVDRISGALQRETVTVIDDRGPGDGELLSLANFYAREDRETREIVLHMSRQGTKTTPESRISRRTPTCIAFSFIDRKATKLEDRTPAGQRSESPVRDFALASRVYKRMALQG